MTKTHNYTDQTRKWGHDLGWTIMPNGQFDAYGWGNGISQGDYIILSNDGAETTRYRFDSIEYKSNPKDMWFAKLSFAPRRAEDHNG